MAGVIETMLTLKSIDSERLDTMHSQRVGSEHSTYSLQYTEGKNTISLRQGLASDRYVGFNENFIDDLPRQVGDIFTERDDISVGSSLYSATADIFISH